MRTFLISLVSVSVTLSCATASELIQVSPITDRILLVHFDDGYVERHSLGERRSDDQVFVDPLDVELATNVQSYTIVSPTDSNFSSAVSPVSIGRKSKATDFSWICDSYVTGVGCVNERADAAREHWLYLNLSDALQEGHEYTLDLGVLNGDPNVTFNFDTKTLRSEAVHVNQIGYVPEATKKFGYVYAWLGDQGSLDLTDYAGNAFHLLDRETNQTVYSGSLVFRKSADNPETFQAATDETPNRNFSAADVYECDFSSFSTVGKYRLCVEGIGASFDFEIHPDIYREPYRVSARGLYHNRSGIALEKPYTVFTRPAPHNPNITPGFDGVIKYTSSRILDWVDDNHSEADKAAIEDGILGPINTWGWYQDAGDWDGYVTHMEIPNLLMFAFEAASDNFVDGGLNIPESGDGLPDILSEARWLIRFYHRTRYAMEDAGYGTGGIGGGRVAGDWFGGDEKEDRTTKASWTDVDRTYIVSGEDPLTSYKYAGLAAQFAFLLQQHRLSDPEQIDWAEEAKTAYDWAQENTLAGDENRSVTGAFVRDNRLYAAAALYQLTGDVEYQTQFENDIGSMNANSQVGENPLWGAALFANIANVPDLDLELQNRVRDAVINTGDLHLVDNIDQRACRWGGNMLQPMNVGQSSTPMIVPGLLAYLVVKGEDETKESEYLNNMRTTADYFLGNNPLNMTWVSGLGERRPERLFHMDSWYNGRSEMAPGIVPYGPWQQGNVLGGQEIGPWAHVWANNYIHPEDINVWPGHERWFDQWTSPLTNEFTVHQNTVITAAVYAVLCGSQDVADKTGPDAPASTSIDSLDASEIQIVWSPSEDDVRTVGYNVYLNGSLYDFISTPEYNFSGLLTGMQYFVKIAAVDHAGNESEDFAEVQFVTQVSDKTKADLAAWRLQEFGTETSSGDAADDADPDGDGVTNVVEFFLGTDPNLYSKSYSSLSKEMINGELSIVGMVTSTISEGGVRFEESTDLDKWSGLSLDNTIRVGSQWLFVKSVKDLGDSTPFFVRWKLDAPGLAGSD